MVEDCGGSVETGEMRIKKDREAATNGEEEEYCWIQFPNGTLDNDSHWRFYSSGLKDARRENAMCLHSVWIQSKP